MAASWQDNKTVIQCNENMLDYALGRSANCKFLNAPATDMVFKVLNTRRIGVHNFRLESIKDAGSEEQGISSEEAVTELPKVGNYTIMRAHSFVLTSRSSYFAEIWASSCASNVGVRNVNPMWTTKVKNHRDILDVTFDDIEPDAFERVLRYLYTDVFLPSPELVMFTLDAAKKFKIPYLHNSCVDYIDELLQENIDPESLMMIADHSEFFNEDGLMNKCRRLIVRHTKQAINSANFDKISHQTLTFILQAGNFRCSELEMFLACKKWAEFQCRKHNLDPNGTNIRRMLNDFEEAQTKMVFLMHLPVIPLDDYVEHVSMTGVLIVDEEEVKILRYMGKKAVSTHVYDVGPFKTNDRCFADIGVQTISKKLKTNGEEIGYDENALIHHDVSAKEENQIFEMHIQLKSEIPVIIQRLVLYNQLEGEEKKDGGEESEEEKTEVKVNYVSKVEIALVDGPYAMKAPNKSQLRPFQAELQLGDEMVLEARKTYNMTVKYTFNVKPSSTLVPFVEKKEQHFADDFNIISFYNHELKMMPFVEVQYKAC